jgi:hypothetical protein
MIAVIFEVWPNEGQRQTYLDIAADLRKLLEEIDGFISVERFESLGEENPLPLLLARRASGRHVATTRPPPRGADRRPRARFRRLPPARG